MFLVVRVLINRAVVYISNNNNKVEIIILLHFNIDEFYVKRAYTPILRKIAYII